MAEYYADKGVWPQFITSVGDTTGGKYVDTIVIQTGQGLSTTLIITATMKGTGVNSGIASAVYALATADGGKTWDCGTFGAASGTTTLATKYLPGACKP
jgi:type IV pilus assembly protein PilA